MASSQQSHELFTHVEFSLITVPNYLMLYTYVGVANLISQLIHYYFYVAHTTQFIIRLCETFLFTIEKTPRG